MSEKGPGSGLLSRLAAPLAKAARRVVGRNGAETADGEVQSLMEKALADHARASARLTDDDFLMAVEQMVAEGDGAFQIKLHLISLVEFHEAVGDKWGRIADKVMMIAEGVINLHLGAGNIFSRQGSDCFVLLFRNVDNDEGRRRSVVMAQELGTRLVGDQFIGDERPLALAAELSLEDGLNPDGSLNMAAVDDAVAQIRSVIAGQAKGKAPPPPAWMRGNAADEDGGLRRHLMPSDPPPPPEAEPDNRPPIKCGAEPPPKAPPPDPGWQPMTMADKAPAKDPTWLILDVGAAKQLPPELDEEVLPDVEPLPPDARLALIWRPTWVAANETIGAYKARIQRVDGKGKTALEGILAYPRNNETAANSLDRFCIANAIRDLRASDNAGHTSTVVLPIHWSTMVAENRMDFLAPFADITPQLRGARVMIELFGVPADVKPMVLGTVIQGARTLCREVALRTRLSAPRAALAADCGASMIGLDLSELANAERTDDSTLLAALQAYVVNAAKARLGTYVWGVRRRQVIAGAVQAGFDLVNGPALMKDIPKPAKVLPAPKARLAAAR